MWITGTLSATGLLGCYFTTMNKQNQIENATRLSVFANVRYWEDTTVNGVQDVDGILIPFRKGDAWHPVIELDTGKILDWPKGTTAIIHYKVCDDGEYYIGDNERRLTLKWAGDYVPDKFLCHGDNGYGDYIIFYVDENGFIKDWRKPVIKADEWKQI